MTGFLRPSILAKLTEMAARLEELTGRMSDPKVLAHPERLAPLQREIGTLQRVIQKFQQSFSLVCR